jgi:tetratricopeptide (TPR) repeat protein
MVYRKYLILLAFIFLVSAARAQQDSTAMVDSTAEKLYHAGDWDQLIIFGKNAVTKGLTYPGLRFKLGYAYMLKGNYKAALTQFDETLAEDAYNSTAHLFAYYCNTYLNNSLGASYHAKYLEKETLSSLNISPFGLIDVAAETGIKLPNNDQRDNGFFERIGVSNRLSWRLQLEQSALLFKQNILRGGFRDHYNQTGRTDRQWEYFLKTKFALSSEIQLIGSYHYLRTSYRNNYYHSNLGLIGIKYNTRYFDLQGDWEFGKLIDKTVKQYNARVDFYPTGNLNLYAGSRVSLLNMDGNNRFVYNQAVGFKAISKVWLESSVTFGNLDNYLDADGLYVYNSIDPTMFKCGQTVFYQLGRHALLNLNYIYERKTDIYRYAKYNQNSITLGMIWKF